MLGPKWLRFVGWFVAWMMVLGGVSASVGWAAEFALLDLQDTPTALTLSEDGKSVFVAHEHADSVSVVETLTGKLLTTIDVKAPSAILARGNQLLVANNGEGTISIYTQKGAEFELTNEVEVGEYKKISWLSAPGGKFYKGWVLATCLESERFARLSAVNVLKDRHHPIGGIKASVASATVSYDGKKYLAQDHPWGGGGMIEFRDFAAAIAGNESESAPSGPGTAWLLMQAQSGPYWFGAPTICKGQPPNPAAGEPLGRMTVPDRMLSACYAIDPTTVRCYALGKNVSLVGEQATAFPAEYERMKRGEYRPNQTQWQGYAGHDRQNIAATVDGKLAIYLWADEHKSIYFTTLDAFDLSQAPTAEIASAGADDGPGEAPPTEQSRRQLPEKSPIGKALTVTIEVVPGATLELVSGPKSAKLASDGTLTWTPATEDLGPQQIKIRLQQAKRVDFIRLKTEVVANGAPAVATNVAGAATSGKSRPRPTRPAPAVQPSVEPGEEAANEMADDLDPADFKFVPLQDTAVGLSYSLDGNSLLVMDGNLLSVLDKSGQNVTKSHEFESKYRQIFERPEYYVALAAKSVDLINKQTFDVERSIEVDYAQLNSLAIHPRKKVCYVGVMKPSEKDFVASKPVLEVNEETSDVRVLPDVFGMWLTVDPNGERLVTGLQQIYKNENTFSLRDEFAHIDIVAAYDLTQADVPRVSINEKPGANGRRLVMSTDGRHVSYVAGGGAGGYGYSIAALAVDDVSRESSRYKVEAYPTDIAYNPTLNLVACTNGSHVWVFNRSTGEAEPKRLGNFNTFKEVERLYFSPAGDHLLVAFKAAQQGPILQAIPLELTGKEKTTAASPNKSAAQAKSATNTGPGARLPIKRTWSDTSGKFKVEAELVEFTNGVAVLKRANGQTVRIKASILSNADQQALKQWK